MTSTLTGSSHFDHYPMSQKRKVLQGSASNMLRVALSMLVSLVLPPFLVHRMSTPEYSAWVLILQMSGYVAMLDLGLQTAVGKFVAEYHALDDRTNNRQILSTSFVILSITALAGAMVIAIITWQVPQLFHQMPSSLVLEVRESLLVVGLSVTFSLPFGAFLATFTGLQEYSFPTVVSSLTRILSAAGLVILLLLKGTLVQLALLMGAFNMAASLVQFLGWRRYVKERVDFSLAFYDRQTAVRLMKYGAVLSLWSLAGLLISGLDIVIVGHYDYKNTGFYAVASSVTNFMLLIIGSTFGPLLPAVSSLQAGATPKHIGEVLTRVSRYCTLLLCLIGAPLLVGAYPLLSLWVGHKYAMQSTMYVEILVVGNIFRQLMYPYALMVVATGKQHLATIAALSEALVNIGVSIFLVKQIGALGVAIGTLVGAFVSLALHLSVSMYFTQSTIRLGRRRYVWRALFLPLLSMTPTLLLYPFLKRFSMLPANPGLLALWLLLTLVIAWRIGLTAEDRRGFIDGASRLLYLRLQKT